jgi:hypothetical protein
MTVELLQEPRTKNAPAAERRRSTRFPIVTQASLFPANTKDDWGKLTVILRDISLNGIGFRSAIALSAGEVYHIDIGAGPLKLHARLRVVNCRNRKDGMYDVGAEFF